MAAVRPGRPGVWTVADAQVRDLGTHVLAEQLAEALIDFMTRHDLLPR